MFASSLGARRAVNLAPPSELGSRHGRGSGERLTRDEEALVSYLFESAGLEAGAYRSETLRRRIPACLRALRATSARAARHAVEIDPTLRAVAMNAMIIGVTSFFRDAGVFDQLTYHVLPQLARREREIRVWSAACSNGSELYSVGILLAELGVRETAQMLGTDIRCDALSRARMGVYDEVAVKEVPPAWRSKYFTRDQSLGWRLEEAIALRARWRRSDLLTQTEPGPWDLILCRNVGMYLRPDVAGRLWMRLEEALAPGGYLVLGKAERAVGISRLSAVAPCIYRRDRG